MNHNSTVSITNPIQTHELMQEFGTKTNSYNKAIKNINSDVSIVGRFAFLKFENIKLTEFGSRAEDLLEIDPVTSIIKIGQFAELLAQQIAEKNGLNIKDIDKQYDLIQKLKENKLINPQQVSDFHLIRENRNKASHYPFEGDSQTAHTLLKYGENLALWYYQEFIKNSSSTPIRTASHPLIHEYQNTVTKLKTTITNYEAIKNESQSLPNTIIDLEDKKKNILTQINTLKNQAQQRQNQEKYQYEIQKQQLLERQKKLELKQIKIEIDISDLQGFEYNFEISTFIRKYTLDKARIESELIDLNQKIIAINSKIKFIQNYNVSEKTTLKKLLSDYDNIKFLIQKVSQPQYFDVQLEQQKKEIVLTLQNIELMMQRASKESIYLPCLPVSVFYTIDKYNLYQLS